MKNNKIATACMIHFLQMSLSHGEVGMNFCFLWIEAKRIIKYIRIVYWTLVPMKMGAISVFQQKWYNSHEIGKNFSVPQSTVNSVTIDKTALSAITQPRSC